MGKSLLVSSAASLTTETCHPFHTSIFHTYLNDGSRIPKDPGQPSITHNLETTV